MAKGIQKSDEDAKEYISSKLAKEEVLSRNDVEMLQKISRTELIELAEDHGYKLKTYQQNSVKSIIKYLISFENPISLSANKDVVMKKRYVRESDKDALKLVRKKLMKNEPWSGDELTELTKINRMDIANLLVRRGHHLSTLTKNSVQQLMNFIVKSYGVSEGIHIEEEAPSEVRGHPIRELLASSSNITRGRRGRPKRKAPAERAIDADDALSEPNSLSQSANLAEPLSEPGLRSENPIPRDSVPDPNCPSTSHCPALSQSESQPLPERPVHGASSQRAMPKLPPGAGPSTHRQGDQRPIIASHGPRPRGRPKAPKLPDAAVTTGPAPTLLTMGDPGPSIANVGPRPRGRPKAQFLATAGVTTSPDPTSLELRDSAPSTEIPVPRPRGRPKAPREPDAEVAEGPHPSCFTCQDTPLVSDFPGPRKRGRPKAPKPHTAGVTEGMPLTTSQVPQATLLVPAEQQTSRPPTMSTSEIGMGPHPTGSQPLLPLISASDELPNHSELEPLDPNPSIALPEPKRRGRPKARSAAAPGVTVVLHPTGSQLGLPQAIASTELPVLETSSLPNAEALVTPHSPGGSQPTELLDLALGGRSTVGYTTALVPASVLEEPSSMGHTTGVAPASNLAEPLAMEYTKAGSSERADADDEHGSQTFLTQIQDDAMRALAALVGPFNPFGNQADNAAD